MSPSINDLWGAPGSEADEDFDLDIGALMSAVDTSLAESTRFRDDIEVGDGEEVITEPDPEEDPDPAEEVQPVTGEVGAEEVPEESAAEPAPPVATADPLGLLPPARRAALLAIDEASQNDPAVRDRVLAAIREQAAPEPPSLPDDIDEGSVAARLWYENQEIRAQVDQIGAGQKAQQAAFAKQAAVTAADAAGIEFAARYPQLEQSDIVDIARTAAGTGLAARMAAGAPDLKEAYVQALDSVLWTRPEFRSKVQGVTAEAPVAEAEKPETKARKRKLTALSSAASPVSAPAAPKSALETRVDGRLTPQSRTAVVKDIANQLNRSHNEGTF